MQEYSRDPTSRNIYSIYSAPDPSPLSTNMSEVLDAFDDTHLVNLSSTRTSNKTPSISPEQLSKNMEHRALICYQDFKMHYTKRNLKYTLPNQMSLPDKASAAQIQIAIW